MIRQLVPAEIVAPDKVMEVAPVTAVSVAEPPQLLRVAGDELLMVTFGGRLSTMAKFVRLVSAGAVMLRDRFEFPPGVIVTGKKDLLAEIPAPTVYTLTGAEADIPFVTP